MNAATFIRKRALIEREEGRKDWWRRRAMEKLIREAGAVPVVSAHRVLGYRLPNGQVVCIKQRYKTEIAAGLALAMIHSTEGAHVKPVRFYPCHHCRGWHLTSMELERCPPPSM